MKLVREIFNDLTAVFSIKQWKETFASAKSIKKKSFAKTLKLLLPQFLIYYVLFSPAVAVPLYDSLLFHPTRIGPYSANRLAGVPIENIFVTCPNKERLHCWYLKNPDATQVVFISHGNGGNLTGRAELMAMLLNLGLSVFIYDYQGYGKSTGSPSLTKIAEDGNCALNYLLKEKNYKASNVILLGESLGTGVTCKLSTEYEDAGIILLSPYYSMQKLARQKLSWLNIYPDFLFTTPAYDNGKILSKHHAPLLIIHGEKDRLIPPSNSQELFAQAIMPKEILWLKNSGHNDIMDQDPEALKEGIRAFLLAFRAQK